MFSVRLEGSAAAPCSRTGLVFPAGRISGFSGRSLSFGTLSQAFGNRSRDRKSWEIYRALDTGRSYSSTVKQLSLLNTRSLRITAVFFLILSHDIMHFNKTKGTTWKGVDLFTCRISVGSHDTHRQRPLLSAIQKEMEQKQFPCLSFSFVLTLRLLSACWTTVTPWRRCRTGGYSRSAQAPRVPRLCFAWLCLLLWTLCLQ